MRVLPSRLLARRPAALRARDLGRIAAAGLALACWAAIASSTGCKGTAASDAGKRNGVPDGRGAAPDATSPREATVPGWLGAREATSHAGNYLVRWRASLDPVVEGRSFAIDAWVFDARAPGAPLADIDLDVDAGMPQHGHGMAALARVERRADGGWRAEGLRFHMIGAWELVFDITRGARTERAQAWIELE